MSIGKDLKIILSSLSAESFEKSSEKALKQRGGAFFTLSESLLRKAAIAV